jgi:hypothetical protein
MEGAVTLYFPPNYSYPTVLDGATLQILRAIKEGMESEELQKSSDKIISLLFLDKSYGLKPVFPGEEVKGDEARSVEPPKNDTGGKSNAGLIVGMMFLIIIILGFAAGGLYYKRKRDEELAIEEQRRRRAEELNAKTLQGHRRRPSGHSSNSRLHAVFESNDGDDGTTTSDDGDGTTTSDDGDGTTTSDDGDGTTTSDDGDGTTTSDEDSTTSGSKETTTDSSDSESDSASDCGPYGNMYRAKKQRAKKVKSNIVYTGGDDTSVRTGATGATGLHSVSSQRTVKMKNVVLPDVLGVNINMR